MKGILEIADSIDLCPDDLQLFGPYVAKITPSGLEKQFSPKKGKYIVITAITPTESGEGKTTVAIGLGMALWHLGKKGIVTLRQPSLGPIFGMKGGGAGGGKALLLPYETINLGLTGDSYRVTAAHNLLSAFIENHIYRANLLDIDPEAIFWPRAIDINDRALREIIVGANEREGGFPHRGQFVLTEASEVMAILSLSSSLKDMRERLGRILVALDRKGKPVLAEDIRCGGAMAVLLRDAMRPNLLQTSEGTPAFVHTGPFANIAPGISSIVADRLALTLSDYVITEAGFGADLGFEKLIDIKCRMSDLYPDGAVLVCTLRSLKVHGGGPGGGLDALEKGIGHLEKQISNIRYFGVPLAVAINRFERDTSEEIRYVIDRVEALGVPCVSITPWKDGGAGVIELGKIVEEISARPSPPRFLYDINATVTEKITKIATTMYGAGAIHLSDTAENKVRLIERLGFSSLPVCMAKTYRSLSHDPTLVGTPEGFTLPIEDIRIASGAGFVYPLCSKIYPLPGLPSRPLGEQMDIDTETWEVKGLS